MSVTFLMYLMYLWGKNVKTQSYSNSKTEHCFQILNSKLKRKFVLEFLSRPVQETF